MISDADIYRLTEHDSASAQFAAFIIQNTCPRHIPETSDENAIALRLIGYVSKNDSSKAADELDAFVNRRIGENSVWINNDLVFSALVIAALKFGLHHDFVRTVADFRIKMSAGNSHKGLALAARASLGDNPDYTELSGIFSLVFSMYSTQCKLTRQDYVRAFNSFCHFDWTQNTHTPIVKSFAVRGIHEIINSIEVALPGGEISDLCVFARSFPRKVSIISRFLSFAFALLTGIAFIISKFFASPDGKWASLTPVLTSLMGVTSLWAISSIYPRTHQWLTKLILRMYGYPKKRSESLPPAM